VGEDTVRFATGPKTSKPVEGSPLPEHRHSGVLSARRKGDGCVAGSNLSKCPQEHAGPKDVVETAAGRGAGTQGGDSVDGPGALQSVQQAGDVR
jgi:hypothetical protein